MNDHTKSVTDIFEFNSTMVRVGLEDLTNEHATHQVRAGEGSSISYLVGHMLASRIGALKMLGVETENPYSELFGGAVPARDGSDYPDVSELVGQWNQVSESFAAALADLGADDVLAPCEGFPIPDQTVRGALMFWAWHESYHLGQLGIMRTELGYPSLQSRLYAEMQAAETQEA
jgi:uncharacterized damage-inducible protein DinB